MSISRRKAISMMVAAPAILRTQMSAAGAQDNRGGISALPVASGPFQGTRASLKQWQVPDWYRDAKFGIWAHLGAAVKRGVR